MKINANFTNKYLTNINKTSSASNLITKTENKLNTNGVSNITKPKKSMFKTIINYMNKFIEISKENTKAMGVCSWDMLKYKKYGAPVIPATALFTKLSSIETLSSNIAIKMRKSNKVINGHLEKLKFKDGRIIYILKDTKNKQLGFIETSLDNNKVHINFMNNIIGRKKYRNIENTLVQGMVEDCIKNGFIPNIEATAVNIGEHMGRGYNNRALYKRMGMEEGYGSMYISSSNVKELILRRIKNFGEIISGTTENLKKLKEPMNF